MNPQPADKVQPARFAPENEGIDGYRPHPWWQVVLLGLASGSAGGLIGVGGGIVMVPVLTLWGMGQKRAQGTSLAVIVAIVPLAVASYYVLGNVDFRFALPLALGGAIGGWLGSHLAQRFSNRALGRFFGAFLVLVALRMLFISKLAPGQTEWQLTACGLLEAGLFGLLAGAVAGFFGVGGGIVFVPTGVLLAGLTQAVSQGSSFTAMLPTALAGTLAYKEKHEIAWDLLRWLVPSAWIGVMLGSFGADVIPGPQLRVVFACFLLYTGARRVLGKRNDAGRVGKPPNG